VKARAPGKLVLSGAYAVLDGAPALVTAVDRYVTADAARVADFVTPEVRAALGDASAPWFDASELREGNEKLGVGSSAAIVVASIAARVGIERGVLSDAELAELVLERALSAHATAQGGGSGVDVAAASFGGTLAFHRASGPGGMPNVLRVGLPPGLVIETWWSGRPATTSGFVQRVRALEDRDSAAYAELMGAQRRGAERALRAVVEGRADEFALALDDQRRALVALGLAAGADIVTDAVQALAEAAPSATVLPAGAGGGDIVLYVGRSPSPPEFRAVAATLGHRLLALTLDARGVHFADYPGEA
jgi:phosphomevalonate kinase